METREEDTSPKSESLFCAHLSPEDATRVCEPWLRELAPQLYKERNALLKGREHLILQWSHTERGEVKDHVEARLVWWVESILPRGKTSRDLPAALDFPELRLDAKGMEVREAQAGNFPSGFTGDVRGRGRNWPTWMPEARGILSLLPPMKPQQAAALPGES